jgi:hypothetical protein
MVKTVGNLGKEARKWLKLFSLNGMFRVWSPLDRPLTA